MKRKIFRSKIALIAAAALTMSMGMGFSASAEDGELPITSEYFPDATFRSYVSENFDSNNDDVLSDAEISGVKIINVSSKNIQSLKGVEYFTALTKLDCNKNYSLTTLDVSKNVKLWLLSCDSNQLTTLDVSNNTRLTNSNFNCNGNIYDIGKIYGEYDLKNLPAGFDVSKASNWQGATLQNGKLTDFDGGTVSYDYDCGNNKKATFKLVYEEGDALPGDINGDGKINNTDIILLGRAYMAGTADKYIANADMNKDGKITNTDIILLGRLYMSQKA